jgi:hypothetical protein
VGLPASPAIQCPGLTRIGHHRADEPTDQRPRGSHARRLSPTEDSRLPRPRSPSCPSQQRRFPLGIAVLAVVYASHYPLQRRSRGTSTDVQGRLQENLQEDSGTPRRLRHHTRGTTPGGTQRRRFPLGMAVLAVVYASHHPLQRRSRGTSTDVQGRLQENLQEDPPRRLRHSKKTQAPHPGAPHPEGTSTDAQGRLQEDSGTTPPAPHHRSRLRCWSAAGFPDAQEPPSIFLCSEPRELCGTGNRRSQKLGAPVSASTCRSTLPCGSGARRCCRGTQRRCLRNS